MIVPVFVDTNVFLYALDPDEPRKQTAAQAWRQELWQSRRGRTSFQVLQEFYVNAVRKWPAARNLARTEVRDLLRWRPASVSGELLHEAWRLQDRHPHSFWDALTVAAAKAASCAYVPHPGLASGSDFGGLIVVDPFLRNPASI